MAELSERPYPPGRYPVLLVGSGPGGLQTSYLLRRRGIRHAAISADPEPGGMFRRYPVLGRLLSWSKPYAPAEPESRAYEWYDWNCLLAEPEHRVFVSDFIAGDSHYPTRAEMAQALQAFSQQASITFRYDCRWEATRQEDGEFVLETSDGEFRSRVVIFAIGMAQPWKPDIPGLEAVPHYAETRPLKEYAGKRVALIGKENSGFELADGMLPYARQIVLASPGPARFSVMTRSLAGARTRYIQPFEDYVLGAGTFALDASIERVEKVEAGYRVLVHATAGSGQLALEVDEVIAATGFAAPLQDLRKLGLATFARDRLPSLTPYWESATVPGVFFAGTLSTGARGLKKHGVPSNSAAVQGHRYNAAVLVGHLARTHFGWEVPKRAIDEQEVVAFLLEEATKGPELLNQKAYLARVVGFDPVQGVTDDGIQPLVPFLDKGGPNAVAMTVETSAEGEIRPVVYVWRNGALTEHILESHPLLDFSTPAHQAQLRAALGGLLSH